MASPMRRTFSASNSPEAPPESRVDAVLESATVALAAALGAAAAGAAGVVAALAASLAAAWLPCVAAACGLSAGLPIFMVLSNRRRQVRAHQHGRTIGVVGGDFRAFSPHPADAGGAHSTTSTRRSPEGKPVNTRPLSVRTLAGWPSMPLLSACPSLSSEKPSPVAITRTVSP